MKTEIVANDKSYKIIVEWKKAPREKWLAIRKVAESIEAYINDESIPLDKPVKPATNVKVLTKKLEELIQNCYDKGQGAGSFDPMQPLYAENIKKLKKEIIDSWLSV